jgi:type IV secretory pathway VirB9-like protein
MSKAVARSLTPDNSKGGAPRRQKRPFWFKYRIPKSLLKKQQAQQEKQAKLAAAKKPAAKPEPKSKMKIKREKKKISRGRRR